MQAEDLGRSGQPAIRQMAAKPARPRESQLWLGGIEIVGDHGGGPERR